MSSIFEDGTTVVRCTSCNIVVPLNQSMTDPNGKPLCKPCFNHLALSMKTEGDDELR